MPFLGVALTFTGYLLVYAAVANGGKFAAAPWLGALADAYTNKPAGPNVAGPAPVQTPVLA